MIFRILKYTQAGEPDDVASTFGLRIFSLA